MSNTLGRTHDPPSNGTEQIPTLMPPVSAKALRFWSWYCHRSPIEGVHVAGALVRGGELSGGVPDEDEQEARNTKRSTIGKRRLPIATRLSTELESCGQFRGTESEGQRGTERFPIRSYALTPGAGAQRL